MRVGLDTSVVVRLLCGEPPELAEAALDFVLSLRKTGGQAVVSDMVLAEAYYALHYHYSVPKAEVLDAFRRMVGSGDVEALGHAPTILSLPRLASARLGFVDRLIHRHYLHAGADAMATFERAAGRLPQAHVITPQTPTPGI